jgi:uncharacterized membrane protein YbhN (UPF0104 family)
LFVTAVAMYLLDAAALAAATRSVLPGVPWAALALGWVLGQIGMALQLTPGGLGLVETSLGGALLGAGPTMPQAVVVVAVYRGANWFLPALLGWAVYLLLGTRSAEPVAPRARRLRTPGPSDLAVDTGPPHADEHRQPVEPGRKP